MTNHTHMTRGGRYGVAALLLLGTSAAAIAQQATTPATGDAMVNADTATHMAELTGAGEGTAWFFVDEQNNSIRWTIEYTGVEATGATIMCPTDADAAAGAAAPAATADADMGTTAGLTGQITRVDRTDGAAPAAGAGADAGAAGGAGMTPAAPAAGADAGAAGGAGMTPAAPAAGADAGAAGGAGMTPAAPAAGEAGAMADMDDMGEVVNLLDEGGTMTSPLEGQTADLDEATFQHIAGGACFLEITVASAGGADAGAATPATPATPAVPPTP